MSGNTLDDSQLARYSRHLLLPEIDLAGQERLTSSHVVIIGAGGLGSPAAIFLASSGVGRITLIDNDPIDLSNLQRQIAYRNNDIGNNKAQRLAAVLQQLNPEIHAIGIDQYATEAILAEHVGQADAVLDCCDNFTTRFAINAACLRFSKPLISGSAIRFQGQVAVFDPRHADAPCYQCLYSDEADHVEETCRDRGIFAPLVGIIGSIQATESLKILLNIGTPLTGRLLSLDALTMTPRLTNLHKDPRCPACSPAS